MSPGFRGSGGTSRRANAPDWLCGCHRCEGRFPRLRRGRQAGLQTEDKVSPFRRKKHLTQLFPETGFGAQCGCTSSSRPGGRGGLSDSVYHPNPPSASPRGPITVPSCSCVPDPPTPRPPPLLQGSPRAGQSLPSRPRTLRNTSMRRKLRLGEVRLCSRTHTVSETRLLSDTLQPS